MKSIVRAVIILAVLCLPRLSRGESPVDEQALRELPNLFCAAWAKHDGHELAKIMAEDVDFVTVGGLWLRGRASFEKYHTRLLEKRFREASNTALETKVRLLRPDLGLVHWSWSIEGDKNPDGSARPKRFGIMTMVAEKRDNRWQVIVAQNTNAGAGAPEADDLDLPIRLPKAESKP